MKSWLTLGAFGSWVVCALLGVYAAGALILWSAMRDNGYYGAKRAMSTVGAMAEGIGFTVEEKAVYAAAISGAYIDGANDRSFMQSHLIGETEHYYARDRTGAWSEVEHVHHALGSEPFARDVKNPREREQLEETYKLREERARAREEQGRGISM